MNVKPINGKILVQKCVEGVKEVFDGIAMFRKGNVVIPEMSGETTNWVRVEDVAEDCKLFSKAHIGGFIRLPEYSPNNVHRVPNTEFFIVRESIFKNVPSSQSYLVV